MISIGKASKFSGVNIETIRYYEREGVIDHPGRTAAGRRVYTSVEVANLRFVKRCRNLGFSLFDIRVLLRLGGKCNGSCAEVRRVSEGQIQQIQAKISSLQKLEVALKELTADCKPSDDHCPMFNTLMGDDWP